MPKYHIPPVDDQFVSDAWNTLDPHPTAYEIAQLWVDQNADRVLSEAQLEQEIQALIPGVKYYLPLGAK